MKNISHISNCTGCGACTQICPKGAITMAADGKGFLYPKIDRAKCVDCGLCYTKCPSAHFEASQAAKPECFAAAASDEIRKDSSSGGILRF